MIRKKRTEITIETDRLVIISNSTSLNKPRPACGREAAMLNINEAAALADTSPAAIRLRVEAKRLHTVEPAQGTTFICFNSLDASLPELRASASEAGRRLLSPPSTEGI